jgi:hypothetical protein
MARFLVRKSTGTTLPYITTTLYELETKPTLNKISNFKNNWIQHIDSIQTTQITKKKKNYKATGTEEPRTRLLEDCGPEGVKSDLSPWMTHDDDDDGGGGRGSAYQQHLCHESKHLDGSVRRVHDAASSVREIQSVFNSMKAIKMFLRTLGVF